MKNKRLIILLSIFSFIILLVVLSSTVFTVRKNSISVEWHREGLTFMQNQNQSIVEKIVEHENIMFYDKDRATKILEEEFPYLKVLKIEKKFPNKIVVHATERSEQYSIKVDNDYYVLDDSGKVLNKYSATDFGLLSAEQNRRPIVVEVCGMTVESSTMQIGKTAQIPRVVTVLQDVSTALKNSGFTETWQVVSNIANIKIEFGYKSHLVIDTNKNGMSICVDDINIDLTTKIRYGFALLNTPELESSTESILTIGYDSNGKLVGELASKNTP